MIEGGVSDNGHSIVIMDNDETTGSYYILFSLYDLLALSHFGQRLDWRKTMEIILRECEELGVFRPGLRAFLQNIADMKKQGVVEKVCLYTNQLDVRDVYHHPHWKTSNGMAWSVPEMIRVMFEMMVDYDDMNNTDFRFIDRLYTRPVQVNKEIDNYPVKDLARVYKDLYPHERVNLSRTIFIDDMYHKKYIIDSSKSKTDRYSRCSIPAYSRQLEKNALGLIVDKILKAHRIELHWHNSILRDSVESSWIHLNSNIHNKNTGRSPLVKTMERIRQFFQRPIRDASIKAKAKAKANSEHKKPVKSRIRKSRQNGRESAKNKRRTRKRGHTSA